MKKYFFLCLIFTGLLFSCQKEPSNKDGLLNESKIKSEMDRIDKNIRGGDKEPCFTMMYPVTFIMPDRSTITGNSREELSAAIKSWYEANPRYTEKKHFMQFPVEINFKGKQMTINNEREMQRIREACKGGKDRDEVPCIELIYPVTYILPDRSTVTGNNKEEINMALRRWYGEHPDAAKRHVLQYPVEIKFKGKPKTINNQREMQRFREACKT